MAMGLDELEFLAIVPDGGAGFVPTGLGEVLLPQADRLMSNVREITKPIMRNLIIVPPRLPIIKPNDKDVIQTGKKKVNTLDTPDIIHF
jgi:hypothetical protein